jgi:hypothetical protein
MYIHQDFNPGGEKLEKAPHMAMQRQTPDLGETEEREFTSVPAGQGPSKMLLGSTHMLTDQGLPGQGPGGGNISGTLSDSQQFLSSRTQPSVGTHPKQTLPQNYLQHSGDGHHAEWSPTPTHQRLTNGSGQFALDNSGAYATQPAVRLSRSPHGYIHRRARPVIDAFLRLDCL